MGSDGLQSVQLGLSRVQRVARGPVREWGSQQKSGGAPEWHLQKGEKNPPAHRHKEASELFALPFHPLQVVQLNRAVT